MKWWVEGQCDCGCCGIEVAGICDLRSRRVGAKIVCTVARAIGGNGSCI